MTSNIQFLFRFRDLVAPTLAEHRKIIRDSGQGQCWWGWWKRPSEGTRSEVWNALQQEIAAQGGKVTVGLFDSGGSSDDSAVWPAVVTKVIPPGADSHSPPSVPSGEETLIPTYYRASTFSRAWLRLSEIGTTPMTFFGHYSYAEAPPLRGVPERYLLRLKNKRVFDSDELRMMDTTIWQVRPATAADPNEKFLAPAAAITEAISTYPIPIDGDVILHLTDLHFAAGTNRGQHVWGYTDDGSGNRTLTDALALLPDRESIGLVIISGDFTFIASREEFDFAYNSINALLGVLGLGPDHVIIVPGNHDIRWTKGSSEQYVQNAKIDNAPAQANQEYGRFFRRLLQHEPDPFFAMGRRFVFANGVTVEICGLNTSSLEQGKQYLAGMGRINPQAFGSVTKALGWSTTRSLAFRILVVHHHLTATEDVEDPAEYYSGFGMAIDAKATLRDAARAGVHLVLHGHRHRTFVWRESVYALPDFAEEKWSLGSIALLGGGSAGSSSVDGERHHINLIRIGSDALTLQMLRSTKLSDFRIIQTWRAPLSLSDGRLSVGDWSVVAKREDE